MKIGIDFGKKANRYFWASIVFAALVILFYIWLYLTQPFSAFANDLLSNVLVVFAAALGASSATLLWFAYDPSDAQRKIWQRFALGLWLWTAAEITWSVVNLTVGEVEIGIPDIFWILAYGPLAACVLRQYDIIVRPSPQARKRLMVLKIAWYAVLIALSALVVVNFFYKLEFVTLVVNAFYPLGEFFLGLAALWMARAFFGGYYARPWFGFLWFAASDLLYAWLEASGLYTWSVESGNFLSGFTDTLYLIAYFSVAIGVLGQWLALCYSFTQRQ